MGKTYCKVFVTFTLMITTCGLSLADLRTLPIGHLKIIDGPEGKINIEARCISTKELISVICEKGKLTPLFEIECRTYDSVWLPGVVMIPTDWFTFLGNPGIHCSIKDGSCRVMANNQDQYDVSLTEAEIFNRMPSPQNAILAKEGINSGLLICDGQVITPPYDVSFRDTQENTAEVTVNKVVIEIVKSVGTIKTVTPPTLPPSGQFINYSELCKYLMLDFYPNLCRKGFDKENALKEVYSFLQKQSLIEKVLPDFPTGPAAILKGTSGRPQPLFSMNYNFDNGSFIREGRELASSTYQAQEKVADIIDRLKKDTCMIISQDVILQPDRTAMKSLLEKALQGKDVSIQQAECLLNEELSGQKQIARLMAVRLHNNRADFIRNLKKYVEKEK